jgi:hypothetical protein
MQVLTKGFADNPLDPVAPGGETNIPARNHHPESGTTTVVTSEKH